MGRLFQQTDIYRSIRITPTATDRRSRSGSFACAVLAFSLDSTNQLHTSASEAGHHQPDHRSDTLPFCYKIAASEVSHPKRQRSEYERQNR
jgi:hypothetical protein